MRFLQFCLTILAIIAVGPTCAAPLLEAGDFEEDHPGEFTRWPIVWTTGEVRGRATIESDLDGMNRFLSLTNSEVSPVFIYTEMSITNQLECILVRGRIRCVLGGERWDEKPWSGVGLFVDFKDDKNADVPSIGNPWVVPRPEDADPDGWSFCEQRLAVPKAAKRILLRFGFVGATGRMDVDDLSILSNCE